MRETPWSEWNTSEWNEALFEHIFQITEGDAAPVTRLRVTRDELRRVVGDPNADLEQVQEAFITAIRREVLNPKGLNNRLDREWRSWCRRSDQTTLPSFLVYLVFTCLVATGANDESAYLGNFQERLRTILNNRNWGAGVRFSSLPRLWKAFADWLDERRKAGAAYRGLILPDPGQRDTLIGYSKQLAFPSRRDLLKLEKILRGKGFDDSPPVREVLRLVGQKIDTLPNIEPAFREFKRKFQRGAENLFQHVFWSVIREAIDLPFLEKTEQAGIKYQLFLERTTLLEWTVDLLSANKPEEPSACVDFRQLMANIPGYSYFVVPQQGDSSIGDVLLAGAGRNRIPSFSRSPINIAISQGVLLFEKNEQGVFELSVTLPESESELRALVRRNLVSSFKMLFSPDDRPELSTSAYDDWIESTDFLCKHISNRYRPNNLQNVRCLQPTIRPVQIRFNGAIPIDKGFLGLPLCLPTVRARGADSITVNAIDKIDARSLANATLLQGEDDTFVFPEDSPALNGRYNILAKKNGGIHAQRKVTFYGRIVWQGYKWPTDTSKWFVEHSLKDMVSLGATDVADYTLSKEGEYRRLPANAAKPLSHRSDIPRYTQDPTDKRRIERFIEQCAGIAQSRTGITEHEFLGIVRTNFGVEDYNLMWNIVRGWLDGGFFERAADRRWRQRIYLPFKPRMVMRSSTGDYYATLTGFAPAGVRDRTCIISDRLGAELVSTNTFSPWVPPLLTWKAPDSAIFEQICHEVEIDAPKCVPALDACAAPIADVTSPTVDSPHGYELRGKWDDNRGLFAYSASSKSEGVEIYWKTRNDGRDVFEVFVNGEIVWWSHSRNWALLLAYTLRGVNPFTMRGRKDLIRRDGFHAYLPTPISRILATEATTTPGPYRTDSGVWDYAYDCATGRLRSLLFAQLWNSIDMDAIMQKIHWLQLQLSRPDDATHHRRIQLPANILRVLAEYDTIPGMHRLCSSTFQPYLIAHVKKLADSLAVD